jgi:hypothetical protein
VARKKKDELTERRQLANRQRWRILIRTQKFWDDLAILNDKLLLWIDCDLADREKFGAISGKKMFQYNELKTDKENRWEITIPDWAVLFSMGNSPSKATMEILDSLYGEEQLEKPMPFPAVRVIRWNAASEFVDLKLDLTKPLDVLIDAVQTAIKPMLPSSNKRNRTDKADFEIDVFDLVQFEKLTFSQISRKLRKPFSTIKSAYVAAAKKIGIVLPDTIGASVDDPGPIYKCNDQRCRIAETPDDFCAVHKAWIDQDQVYLREYLPDTTRDGSPHD